MAKSFQKLTRTTTRKLPVGQSITEHGITYEKMPDGDGRFTVNIMVDSVRVHRVIGKESEGVTREKAEEYVSQARTDSRAGRLNLPSGRKTVLTLRNAAEQYLVRLEEGGGKDIEAKKRRFGLHVVPFLGNKPLSNITSFDVERFKKHRTDHGAENGTINRELAALSHLITKAMEWNWISHRPCTIKRLREKPVRISYLTIEQAARLVEVSKQDQNPHVYPFIVIGLETGMRKMEILSIQLQNISFERLIIHIPHAKGGSREQPITHHLVDFLRGYVKAAQPGQKYLFDSIASKGGHVTNIDNSFRRVVQSAGLDPKQVVRHTLRHTAITHLVQAGVDLPTVKRISGHKTLAMVERYSHQNGAHIQIAMDKLEARYQTGTDTKKDEKAAIQLAQ